MPLRAVSVFVAAFAGLVTSGCAEGTTLDKRQLEDARRAFDRKEVEVRAYQWQLATLTQQLQTGQQRSDTMQRELFAQVQHLTAENAALSERLARAETERAALAAVPLDGKAPRDSVDGLRRALAASEAQNNRVAEELARIGRILGARAPEPLAAPKGAPAIDVVDPWGFGSRK
jgi:hypothetical protein